LYVKDALPEIEEGDIFKITIQNDNKVELGEISSTS